jgi:cytochrome oxidase assembly protein ShyY1
VKRRIPFFATLVVALAVAAMIALGFWQIARLSQKEAALAAYRANLDLPIVALPAADAADRRFLFRAVSADCRRVLSWQVIGGRSAAGAPGWRHIAHCATGAAGPGLLVDMGVSLRPQDQVGWTGGPVSGRATLEPDTHGFIQRLAGSLPPLRLMIVSDRPAPGLAVSPPPDPASVPNNHLAYAVQWFLFAGVALVIYGLALRRRWREQR